MSDIAFEHPGEVFVVRDAHGFGNLVDLHVCGGQEVNRLLNPVAIDVVGQCCSDFGFELFIHVVH